LGNPRCKRFSLLVDDGIVKKVNVAEGPGDPAGDEKPEISMVEQMLGDLMVASKGSATPAAETPAAETPAAGGATVVDKFIADNEVVVFASETCPFCKKAISSLNEAGFKPTVVEVDEDMRNVLVEKCGSRSVPKVFVKGNFVGGCNDGGMGGVVPLLASGKIKELMAR